MKKFTLILSIIFTVSLLSLNDSQAQTKNSNPASEEVTSHNDLQSIINVNQGLSSSEERKINVVVEDQKPD